MKPGTGARGGPYPTPLIFWNCDQRNHTACEATAEMPPIKRNDSDEPEPRIFSCQCPCHPLPKKRGRPPKVISA